MQILLGDIVVMTASRAINAQRFKSIFGRRYKFLELSSSVIETIKTTSTTSRRAIIVVFGGDGYMLYIMNRVLMNNIQDKVVLYGINCGNVGFLMNDILQRDNLAEEIEKAILTTLPVLKASCISIDRNKRDFFAINEIAVLRSCYQTAHLRLKVDDIIRIEHLVGDGIIIATPTGSAAYNKSAGGQTILSSSGLLAVTPVNAFRPRGWRGAVIPNDSIVEIEITNPHGRGVNLHADSETFGSLHRTIISVDKSKKIFALFKKGESIENKLLTEQFLA